MHYNVIVFTKANLSGFKGKKISEEYAESDLGSFNDGCITNGNHEVAWDYFDTEKGESAKIESPKAKDLPEWAHTPNVWGFIDSDSQEARSREYYVYHEYKQRSEKEFKKLYEAQVEKAFENGQSIYFVDLHD